MTFRQQLAAFTFLGLCGLSLLMYFTVSELPEEPALAKSVNTALGDRLRTIGVERIAMDVSGTHTVGRRITINGQTADLDVTCSRPCGIDLYGITDRYVIVRKGEGYIVRADISGKEKQPADVVARVIVQQVTAVLDDYTAREAATSTWKS